MDALIAVVAVASLYLAFRRIGWWRWFWVGLAVYLTGFELAAKVMTGKTISQQFWAFSLDYPTTAWVAASSVALGGLGLAAHLLWKLWHKED